MIPAHVKMGVHVPMVWWITPAHALVAGRVTIAKPVSIVGTVKTGRLKKVTVTVCLLDFYDANYLPSLSSIFLISACHSIFAFKTVENNECCSGVNGSGLRCCFTVTVNSYGHVGTVC